jgi:hypothetical protein
MDPFDTNGSDTESRAIKRSMGKWGQADVPRKGWQCIGTEDLERPAQTCEMCESKTVRYVHTMSHPDYAIDLMVGRICAGYMSEDYVGIDRREREARNATKRKRAAEKRAEKMQQALNDADELAALFDWRQSQNYNWWTKAPDGWRIHVFEAKRGGWKYMMVKDDGEPQWGRTRYDDHKAAQQAAERIFAATL